MKILNINSIQEYNDIGGNKTYHPLVSVIDFSKSKLHQTRDKDVEGLRFSFYCIFLKGEKNLSLRYGRNYYDYQEGTLVFFAPGQEIIFEGDVENGLLTCHGLFFHPDLLKGTRLGQRLSEFTFFSYNVHEALHLSDQEKEIVMESFRKIEYELEHSIDKHSKKLIVSNIELFLDYCVRFYHRQFITRDDENKSFLKKFELLLDEYFISEKPQTFGIPTVTYFADQVHLSPNYFGDMIKKETGRSALEFIQIKMIGLAKEKMMDKEKTVGAVANELGFKYPQHFTRFFRNQVGYPPNQYRNSDN